MRAAAARLAAALAIVALGWAAAISLGLTGGVTFHVAGAAISSTNAWRPFAIGLGAAIAAVLLVGPSRAMTWWRYVAREMASGRFPTHPTMPARAALMLAAVTGIVSLAGNSWTASGPDSFAYVSQAELWRAGRLAWPVPLAANAPWPDRVATFAPFGYRAAPGAAPEIVPTTTPGLPMMMAALQRVAGYPAAFLVTPLAGAALVLLTFAIGRRVRSPVTGLIAAWLVATSPALLFMLMWPMTDVPAAACAALLVWLLLKDSTASALAAGLVASAGILMRPNFIAIAAAAALWPVVANADLQFNPRYVRSAPRRAAWFVKPPIRVLFFLAGLLPGVLVMAWVNSVWYGSPLASGYGAMGDLFSVSHIWTNAGRYGRWLIETSPLAVAGLGALVFPARVWPRASGRRTALLLALVTISACGVYLLYEPYTEWWYLRFLLPAWPAIFVAAAVVLDALRARGGWRRWIALALVVAAGLDGVASARARGVFTLGAVERRYVTVARLVERATEPTAVVLTSQHSGTVRYYAGRETLRYDVIDPAWLDRAVEWLAAQGRHPYVLVEDWEQPHFEARFRQAAGFGRLSLTPVVAWQSTRFPGWVFLYDPLRRDAATIAPGPEIERDQPLCARPAPWPR